MIVEARLHVAHEFAEAQHDAEFVGLDAEEAGKAPQRDRGQRDQRDAAAAEIARQQAAQPVLAAAQEFFEIGRLRAPAVAAPSPRVPAAPNPTGRRPDCSTASIISLNAGGPAAPAPGSRGL